MSERYEKCLPVSSSVKGKSLSTPPSGRELATVDGIRWEEIGVKARNRVDSAQDRNYWKSFVNAALNLRVS